MSDLIQGTDEWLQARLGKITASNIFCILADPKTATYRNYAAKLAAERFTGKLAEHFKSKEMERGTETEGQARSEYAFWYDEKYSAAPVVAEVGFVAHPEYEFAGASPDGLVGADGLVEIKCPNTATHMDTLFGKNIDSKYVYQMQFQMACTEREWCDFVSFDPDMGRLALCGRRVEWNTELNERIREALELFEVAVREMAAKLEAL